MYDILIVGAGAAGLACAINAKRSNQNLRVAVVEALPRVGKKILATGNGRCNLTNINSAASSYNHPEFTEYAMKIFSPDKVLDFFHSIGLMTVTDGEGRVYPMSNTASSVLDCLRFEADNIGVETITEAHINSLKKVNGVFVANEKLQSKKVVIASGGKSSPSQGSDGSGYILLKSFGHTVSPTYPGLVQITVEEKMVKSLKGVRVKANIDLLCGDRLLSSAHGEILFTDYGVSGIAAMDVSRKLKNNKAILKLDMLAEIKQDEAIEFLCNIGKHNTEISAGNALMGLLPKAVGQAILKIVGIDLGTKLSSLDKKSLEKIVYTAKNFKLTVTGTKGFANAQITVGGADLNEFNCQTMMSKIVDGLYCVGEVLDIDSVCGGYNLQWAWASGLLAGKNAAM